jgi:NAD(P)-dependent dehydrogenase (short-subunit alcohol dehydrogenase family)
MNLGLEGKVALVTGGSEGIGRATVQLLSREGARVVAVARRVEVLEEVAQAIRGETGNEVLAAPGDVSKREDVERVVQAAVARFGRLDIVINNAGTSRAMRFESITEEAWEADFELKLFAAIRTVRAALPHLRAAGGGSVVNVLSVGAKQPEAGSMPSTVTRAAGMALTKALSKELGPEGVRVNAVLIGLIKSAQHDERWRENGSGTRDDFYTKLASDRKVPLGRSGEAEEAANLIAFLASSAASYLTGTAINMDGGMAAVV